MKYSVREYNKQSRNDLAIIIVIFHTSINSHHINNIKFIKTLLENASIPFFIGEMSIRNTPFIFNSCENIFHYHSNDYLFYKENLINLVEKKINPKFTKLCILDSDIIFMNPDWYDNLSNLLDNCDICQPFEYVHLLNKDSTLHSKYKSFCSNDITNGHTGYGWGFKRCIYNKIGLPDFCIVGNGNLVLSKIITILYKKINYNVFVFCGNLTYLNEEFRNHIKNVNLSELKISFLNIDIYHLFHGDYKRRLSSERHDVLKKFFKNNNISLTDVIHYNSEGILCIKEIYRSKLNSLLMKYFHFRNN
jgi:hypothetical protein